MKRPIGIIRDTNYPLMFKIIFEDETVSEEMYRLRFINKIFDDYDQYWNDYMNRKPKPYIPMIIPEIKKHWIIRLLNRIGIR
jgi:hypothetical protein